MLKLLQLSCIAKWLLESDNVRDEVLQKYLEYIRLEQKLKMREFPWAQDRNSNIYLYCAAGFSMYASIIFHEGRYELKGYQQNQKKRL